jgi:uncharacterized sporulation protein YeaH/YhbH (DUF444 family)
MATIIDRRGPTANGKSLGNRQRFLERAREDVRDAIDKHVRGQKITDALGSGGRVKVSGRGLFEPWIHHEPSTGDKTHVVGGNTDYIKGDAISRPEKRGGGRGNGSVGQGESEDEFDFALSREEFLDMLFADMELPDMVKTMLKDATHHIPERQGYSVVGNPSNLSVRRTMTRAMGRRIALDRPTQQELEQARQDVETEENQPSPDSSILRVLRQHLETLELRHRNIAYVDPLDVRYNRFVQVPQPNSKAVMFCLMDVSGSMDEAKKDLAKRFFILLHLFLERNYKRVDVVFIRHTEVAKEVDEQEFFYSTQSGGTMVSSCLAELVKIQKARYPLEEWNIYTAYSSDGDNYHNDTTECLRLMNDAVLPIVQYFAYIETRSAMWGDSNTPSTLWQTFEPLMTTKRNFQARKVEKQGEIFSVLAELFKRKQDRKLAA